MKFIAICFTIII